MAILIDMKATAAFKRRKWLSMAARAERRSKAIGSRAEAFELRALGVATRHDYVGFTVTKEHRDAPDEAQRYARAARRYREGEYRLAMVAKRINRRAMGIIDGAARTPLGVA